MDYLKKKFSSKKKKNKSSSNSPPQQSQSEPPPQEQKLHKPNPNASPPRGILKNKQDANKYSNNEAYPTSDDIDESLRNAQKNSSLNQSIGTSQNNTNSTSPQNEEEKENKKKGLKWDENNLEKNENEKVPRMKIDEPPTPYAEMPPELVDINNINNDEEEEILDINPMEMSLDDKDDPDLESEQFENKKKTLDQQQQSLLL
eukprot:79188_1